MTDIEHIIRFRTILTFARRSKGYLAGYRVLLNNTRHTHDYIKYNIVSVNLTIYVQEDLLM